MRTTLLQDWITVQGNAGNSVFTVTQEQGGWLDVSSFSGATFWVDVSQAVVSSSPVTLSLQTSPTLDESYFKSATPPLTLSASSSPVIVQTVRAPGLVPLARYLRWQVASGTALGGGNWVASFRIRVALSPEPGFVPTDLGGCVLWLRGDLGVTLNGTTVSAWADQSPSNDANKNLGQSTAGKQPTVSQLSGMRALGLSSASTTFMTSGLWASVLLQPSTWLFVGDNTNGGAAAQYLMDGDDTGHGQAVTYVPSTTTETIFAAGGSFSATKSWATASAFLGEWNGASSKIYFNNFTTAAASGTVNGGASGGQGSMTFGMHSNAFGGGNNWDGAVAEIIAFNRILLPSEKSRLRNYINGRYALGVT
ncbi:MAG TPA: hypothetical protein VGL81_20130 [Polyangiaceae bacterium]|jgi:hypothetical protein